MRSTAQAALEAAQENWAAERDALEEHHQLTMRQALARAADVQQANTNKLEREVAALKERRLDPGSKKTASSSSSRSNVRQQIKPGTWRSHSVPRALRRSSIALIKWSTPPQRRNYDHG